MRKIVFILLAVVICFSPVGVSSQNIFQKAANKISSWFSGGEKERASDKTGHIDITQLTLDENLSIELFSDGKTTEVAAEVWKLKDVKVKMNF